MTMLSTLSTTNKGLHALLWELSDDEDDEADIGWISQPILDGHGSMTTVHTWMFLSKFQKAGRQSSGGA